MSVHSELFHIMFKNHPSLLIHYSTFEIQMYLFCNDNEGKWVETKNGVIF